MSNIKGDVAADMVDFLGGDSGISDLWERFLAWMEEKGYARTDVETAAAEIQSDVGRS